MSLVRLENVSKSFAGEPVLFLVSFRVEEGEKIGLIGRNGTGKSTILRLILGQVEPDSGLVERMKRARIAYLEQMPHLDASDTVFDVVLQSFSGLVALEKQLNELEERIAAGDDALLEEYSKLQEEFIRREGYEFRTKITRVLHGLGFTVDEFELPVTALSGGQRTRLMLALVLLDEADLLLLDEPENHLDLDAREWLETYLKSFAKSFVVVSHDRRMLNTVVDRVVEVERGQLLGFAGNYDAYAANKALLREQQQKAFDRQQEFVKKEESWINRFRYKSTKARQVQSRIKRLDKLERVEAPPPDASAIRLSQGEVVRSGHVVLDVRDASMSYGALRLYEGLSFQVQRGERVGVIGPNGSGKTTLLRQLAGQLGDAMGLVTLGHKVVPSVYDQHHEGVRADHDILTEIRNMRPDLSLETVRSFMGRFLFAGEDVFKPLTVLSGGELSRVALAKLFLSEANLLLLDEPTNHLDIASREVLEQALSEFPGSIVLVSHDRELIDRLVDKLIVIEGGKAEVYLGNYSDYRWRKAQETAASPKQGAGNGNRDAMRTRRRDHDGRAEKQGRDQRRRIEEIEQCITVLEEKKGQLEVESAQLNPADYSAVQRVKESYDGAQRDLDALYVEWERLVEGVEKVQE